MVNSGKFEYKKWAKLWYNSSMRKPTKSAVAITLAIAGAITSPFSYNAAAFELREGVGHSLQSGVIVANAPHNAATDSAFIGLKIRDVKVADDDAITILDAGNNQHKIRLNGIDAPEKSQAFGQKSREYLASLVSGKTVFVVYKSKDRYGRVLGNVFSDSVNVNLEMRRGGYAWRYKRYDFTSDFAEAVNQAEKSFQKKSLFALTVGRKVLTRMECVSGEDLDFMFRGYNKFEEILCLKYI